MFWVYTAEYIHVWKLDILNTSHENGAGKTHWNILFIALKIDCNKTVFFFKPSIRIKHLERKFQILLCICYTVNIIEGKLLKGMPHVYPNGFPYECEFGTRWNDTMLLCSACTVINQMNDCKQGVTISVLRSSLKFQLSRGWLPLKQCAWGHFYASLVSRLSVFVTIRFNNIPCCRFANM